MSVKASVSRAADGKSAVIRWTRQADLTGYEIYQREAVGPWARIHTRGATAISFTATGLDPGKAYEFFVRGREDSPVLSAPAVLVQSPPAQGVLWRAGVILVRRTIFTKPDGQRVDVQWDEAAFENARRLVSLFPAMVKDWSGGLCEIEMSVSEAGPLTTLSPYGSTWWPARNDTKAWWPAGADSIFVLWDADDDVTDEPGLTQHYGLGMGGTPTYGTWAFPDGDEWWWAKTPETMVHEWLHGVVSTFAGRGFAMPDLHSADAYGYPKVNDSYENWYRAVMQGKVRRPDDGVLIGCTPAAWASGPPR